jgi:hypothetical protein
MRETLRREGEDWRVGRGSGERENGLNYVRRVALCYGSTPVTPVFGLRAGFSDLSRFLGLTFINIHHPQCAVSLLSIAINSIRTTHGKPRNMKTHTWPHKTIHLRESAARLGRCRNACAPTIGNHLLRCRVIASTPGTGLPDSFQPDGNDNADAAITLSADNRAPFVIAHDGDLIRPTLAVFSGSLECLGDGRRQSCQRIVGLAPKC